jgi:hypothetical protein
VIQREQADRDDERRSLGDGPALLFNPPLLQAQRPGTVRPGPSLATNRAAIHERDPLRLAGIVVRERKLQDGRGLGVHGRALGAQGPRPRQNPTW